MKSKSTDYHDYVFRNGKLVGDFDGMYKYSEDVPWHQDKIAFNATANIILCLIKSLGEYSSILDIGAGLGYFTSRLAKEFPNAKVRGIDVSDIAVERARTFFKNIEFHVVDCKMKGSLSRFASDLVVCRQLFWYVFDELDVVLHQLAECSLQYLAIEQSFYEERSNFIGSDVIPNHETLNEMILFHGFEKVYSLVHRAPHIKYLIFSCIYKKVDKVM